jgi:hypothetical protein
VSASSDAGTAERVLLSLSLPLAGMFTAFPAAGVAFLAGLHEPGVSVVGALGMVLGVIGTARLAPRVVPKAVQFSVARRTAAGLVGLLALLLVGRCLILFGLDADALSGSPSLWAAAQEGLFMLLTFGTMLAAASATLGRPSPAHAP